MRQGFYLKEGLLLILIIIGTIFVSNYFRKQIVRSTKLDKIPTSLEFKLKRLVKEQIQNDSSTRVVKNKTVLSAVEQVRKRLAKNIKKLPYDIEIIVIDSPIVNAAAFPGGLIVIFSGLIKETQSAEELAAVIAHECGHIVHRDSLNRLVTYFGLGVLLSLSGGSDAAAMIKSIIREVATTSYSRKQEARADEFGLELMIKADLNPGHLADFFERLQEKESRIQKSRLFQYLSTHPDTQSRISKAHDKEELFKGQEKKFNIDWSRIQKALPGIFI